MYALLSINAIEIYEVNVKRFKLNLEMTNQIKAKKSKSKTVTVKNGQLIIK